WRGRLPATLHRVGVHFITTPPPAARAIASTSDPNNTQPSFPNLIFRSFPLHRPPVIGVLGHTAAAQCALLHSPSACARKAPRCCRRAQVTLWENEGFESRYETGCSVNAQAHRAASRLETSALGKSGSGRAASAKGVDGKELGDAIQWLLKYYSDRATLLIPSDASYHGSPNSTGNERRQRGIHSAS